MEWWKDAIGIVQSIFVCLTALIALLGISEWRWQTVSKRKIELAEQVLASFYEARDLSYGFVHPLPLAVRAKRGRLKAKMKTCGAPETHISYR